MMKGQTKIKYTFVYFVHNSLVLSSLLKLSVRSLTDISRDFHRRVFSYHYNLNPRFHQPNNIRISKNQMFTVYSCFQHHAASFLLSLTSLPALCSQTPSINFTKFEHNKPTTH